MHGVTMNFMFISLVAWMVHGFYYVISNVTGFILLEKYKGHSANSVDTMCIMCKIVFGKNV